MDITCVASPRTLAPCLAGDPVVEMVSTKDLIFAVRRAGAGELIVIVVVIVLTIPLNLRTESVRVTV